MLRAIGALVLSGWFFSNSFFSTQTTVTVWSLAVLLDACLMLMAAGKVRDQNTVFLPLVLLGVVGGIIALSTIALATSSKPYLLQLFVTLWALMTGVIQLLMTTRLREAFRGEVFFGLAGEVSASFGACVTLLHDLKNPAAFYQLSAYSALIFGGLSLLFANFLRKQHKRNKQGFHEEPPNYDYT